MAKTPKITRLLFLSALFLCFLPFMSPALALITGVVFSALGVTEKRITKNTSVTLQVSIVLIGFGMNLEEVITASQTGVIGTVLSVIFVISSGWILGKFLKVDSKTGLLISSGTAICGGSAIAAVAPIIGAENHQISLSLAVVFLLNAFALVLFPLIGHFFHLSETTFGYWAAIAIHDTSSVVGAGASYGPQALAVATTVKLVRALWIIPLSFGIALFQKDQTSKKLKIPWFILFFILGILTAYLIPAWKETFTHFYWLGKKGMVVALFFIGSNISFAEIKKTGIKSFILGIALWLLIGVSSFLALTLCA